MTSYIGQMNPSLCGRSGAITTRNGGAVMASPERDLINALLRGGLDRLSDPITINVLRDNKDRADKNAPLNWKLYLCGMTDYRNAVEMFRDAGKHDLFTPDGLITRIERVRTELIETIKRDYQTMPHKEFISKYHLRQYKGVLDSATYTAIHYCVTLIPCAVCGCLVLRTVNGKRPGGRRKTVYCEDHANGKGTKNIPVEPTGSVDHGGEW